MLTPPTVDLWQRRLMIATVPVTALLTIPSAMDPTTLPKLLAGAAVAVFITALTAIRWFAAHRVPLPAGPAAWLAGSFAAATVIATVVAGFETTAVLGQYGRFSGLLLYLSAVLIFVHVLAVADAGLLWKIGGAVTITGGVVAAIGVLQGVGVRFMGLEPLTSPLIGTFGNPNFFASFLGIVVPFALLWASATRASAFTRVGSAVVVVGALVAAVWSRSFQGVVAAGLGMAVFVLFSLHGRGERRSRLAEAGLVVATVAGTALVGLGMGGVGPLAAVVGARAVQFRVWYWDAALRMFGDHPVAGVGMDQYGNHFRRYRSLEAFQAAGVGDATDAVHNVPLSMFANGGLILGLAYVAVLGIVTWAAVSGFGGATGPVRRLLGAFVGAWLASQVQSLVSIDVPSLGYLHWILAGGIVVLGAPWRSSVMVGDARGGKRGKTARRSAWQNEARVGQAAVVGVTVIALWGLSLPLRADVAAGRARQLAAVDQSSRAVERLQRAVDLAPWQSTYHAALGELLLRTGDVDGGSEAFLEALATEPDDFPYTITAARLSASSGDTSRARALYEEALELEPNSAEIATEAAEFYAVRVGNEDRARELVRHALALSPGYSDAEALASELGA